MFRGVGYNRVRYSSTNESNINNFEFARNRTDKYLPLYRMATSPSVMFFDSHSITSGDLPVIRPVASINWISIRLIELSLRQPFAASFDFPGQLNIAPI